MANVRISQLPVAPDPISGSELVPIVQNGQTVQTTVNDLVNSPSQTQTFLTVGVQSSLPNSRYIAGGLGIGTNDGGAQGAFSLFLNGTSASLENASTGLISKTGVNTVAPRSIAAGTSGLSVANGNGVSGNPTVSLTGLALSAATLSGSGIVSIVGGSYYQQVTLTGTANQISIANATGGANPTFSIADNPVIPGSAGMVVPSGTTGQRALLPTNGQMRYNTTTSRFEFYEGGVWATIGTGDGTVTQVSGVTNQIVVTSQTTTPLVGLANNPILPGLSAVTLPKGTTSDRTGSPASGMIRYNTQTNVFEGYNDVGWNQFALSGGVTSFSAGTTGLTPNTPQSGGIVLGGVLVVENGGTGAATLTGYVKGNGTSAMTASATIPTTDLSGTITNAQLQNNSVTYNGVTVALGGSGTITATASNALTIGTGLTGTSYNGSTPVTIAIDSTVVTLTGSQTLTNKSMSGSSNTFTNIPNSALTNSSVTVGTTNIALGGTSLTLAGLTSVTVTQDPTSDLQLATKQYVDTVAQGLDAKASCVYGTTGNITLSGLGTQAGGDWAVSLTTGNRILVKNQSSSQFNGIYVAAAGTWTRSLDMDTWAEVPSSFVFIEDGTTLADTGWVTTANAGGTINVTPMPWVQFSGAGTYNAGTGLTLTGTQFSLTSPVATSLGGTGSTSALTQYGVVYGSTTTAMGTTAAGTSTQVLHGNASGAPTFGAVSLTADVSGTLPVGNGGTGITSLTANYIPYGNGSSAFQSSANHTFDGTTLTLGNAGVSARFQGDFSNATVASRTAFVTGTTNGATGIYALPNGTSTAASWQATNNSSPTNASKILIATNGSTDVQLVSGINGTGTYLPLTFWNNGAEKMRLSVAGGFSIGTATDAGSTNLLVAGTATALGGIAGGTF